MFGAYNFSSPAQNLLGLSYAFKYNGANFVLLDQFTHTDGTGSSSNEVNNTNIANQLPWVIQKLTGITANVHSFVFGHKDLIGEDHVDVLLGADPSQNPSVRNTFIDVLQKLGVRYYISGHDHMYQRSLIESPDSTGYLHQLIGAVGQLEVLYPGESFQRPEIRQSHARDVDHSGNSRNRLLHLHHQRGAGDRRLLRL